MADPETFQLRQVFVVGQLPTVTYSPRESKRLEATLNDYLEERGRILVLTGPTKSGKTVLLNRSIPDALWVAGGNVDSADRFWRRITDETDSFTEEAEEAEREETDTEEIETEAGFKPAGMGAHRRRAEAGAISKRAQRSRGSDRDPQFVGSQAILDQDLTLIIDDFHHIAPDVQRELVRQLKPLIDANAAVIFAAVPHHAADIVAAEGDLDAAALS